LLFCRFMPVINMAEVKATLAGQLHHHHGDH
jgi:molybdopterin-containing oxidoreductase family membrane subunit